jgi:hypothetical protein
LAAPQIMDDAQADWEKQFPQFAQYGWGPSVQAEKWNGRHAMFGWFFICASAYFKGQGVFPEGDLDLAQWGTLATISGKATISTERAIILAANAHFFSVSLLSTFCPPEYGDFNLFTEPDAERVKGYGYMPNMKQIGLTEEAEIINGRLAMLGLTTLLVATAIEQKPILDVVNEWVGGAYF